MNVVDVGNSLNRDPAEITKFFGTELGSQTSYATDRAVVNGAHADTDLQKHLSRYIENFVLCKTCHLPETHYKVKEGLISQKCLACGSKEKVDMTHKLTTFILAQHKKSKELAKSSEKKDKKKDKKDKKDGDDHEGAANGTTSSNGNGNDGSPPSSHKKDKEGKEGKEGKEHKSKDKDGKDKKKGLGISKSNSDVALNVFGINGEQQQDSGEDEESDSKAAG